MTAENFYAKAVALNRERHQNLKIELQADHFLVSARTNSVLLARGEFADASRDYPIIFVGQEGGPFSCAALVGLNDRENLFVGGDGLWETGAYIPAFIRRYPFVLAGADDAESFTVCIDEAYEGLSEKKGRELFKEDGSESDYLTSVVEFLKLFHLEMKATAAFASEMAELKLLVPKVVTIERDGQSKTLDGFWVIDETALNALDDEQTLKLVRSGSMGSIYVHLLSLKNVNHLANRLDAKRKQSEELVETVTPKASSKAKSVT